MLNKFITRVFTFGVLLNLAACTPANTKDTEGTEEEPNIDLLQILKQANIAYANDDLVTSEKNYEILIKKLPEEAEYWFRLGNIYVRTNRPTAAMSLYREAVLRDPQFAKAWYNMSIVQLKQTAFSLNEMLIYTDNEDPLYSKAETMLDQIKSIISEE
jgi:tetratricopeptide (TPR) repeat protein